MLQSAPWAHDNTLAKICGCFTLGDPLNSPSRVYGGLLHRMWRVNTNNGWSGITTELNKELICKMLVTYQNESGERCY